MKTCKAPGCGVRFESKRPFEVWCCADHGVLIARKKLQDKWAKAAKEDRKADRAKREKQRPTSYFESKAQDAINWYVRVRDADKGCASCDLPASWGGQWHASHFRSVGAASAVRFNLWNIHKACVGCNHFKSGNLAGYEPMLRIRIGDAKVDWLKTQNQTVRYQREYLQRLQRVFNKKARRLEKRLGI